MQRKDAMLIRVFAFWTIFIWGTRILNIMRDDRSTSFKAVHGALAAVSVLLALLTLRALSRYRNNSEALYVKGTV